MAKTNLDDLDLEQPASRLTRSTVRAATAGQVMTADGSGGADFSDAALQIGDHDGIRSANAQAFNTDDYDDVAGRHDRRVGQFEGNGAVAIGYNCRAKGTGRWLLATMPMWGSIAVGIGYVQISGANAVAVGNMAAAPEDCVAIGNYAGMDGGTQAVAIGDHAWVEGAKAVAVGGYTFVQSEAGVAVGYGAQAGAAKAVALGPGVNNGSRKFGAHRMGRQRRRLHAHGQLHAQRGDAHGDPHDPGHAQRRDLQDSALERHDENDTLRGGPASLGLNTALQYPDAEPGDLCVWYFWYS